MNTSLRVRFFNIKQVKKKLITYGKILLLLNVLTEINRINRI